MKSVPNMTVDYVQFHVTDAPAMAAELTDAYGFEVLAHDDSAGHHSLVLGQQDITFVLTEGVAADHPACDYVGRHGDGVADIALRVDDVRRVFDDAVAAGAEPLAEPAGRDGCLVGTIGAFGDVTHTLVQHSADGEYSLPGFGPIGRPTGTDLRRIDHFGLCVPVGELAPTARFYENALGFRSIFEERIAVGKQGMVSKAVQSASGEVTLTIMEPEVDVEPGQIDAFVADHGGAGVQHLAFAADDIRTAVSTLADRGVEFLEAPGAYYDLLAERLEVVGHRLDQLRTLNILVDEDHDGQLFQIFTRSRHPRRTLFFEIIERQRATTFGSGNIRTLFEAVEMERNNTRALT